jgi:hypothetical protein
MAWHLYLCPIIGAGTFTDQRHPKYISDLGVQWSMIDYGFQPFCLVAANVSDAQDAALVLNSDVTKIPDNLDSNVAVTATQNALESLQIPANWINASNTYRQVLRIVWGMFNFFQRYSVISGTVNPLIDGITISLSTQFSSLPLKVRQDLIATAQDLNLDTSSLSGNSTLRQILKALADSWGQRSFTLGGITI